jgi:hypothetical protein
MPSGDSKSKPRWTKEEDETLKTGRKAGKFFNQFTEELPHRSPGACKKRMGVLDRKRAIPAPSRKRPFTVGQDDVILKAKDEEDQSFDDIAESIQRSRTQTWERYQELILEGRTRPHGNWEGREWQIEEDNVLRRLLRQYEGVAPPWSSFERFFHERSGRALLVRAIAMEWVPGNVPLYSGTCSWTVQEDKTIRAAAQSRMLDSELDRIGIRCDGIGKTPEEVALRWQCLKSLPEEDAKNLAIMQERDPRGAERLYHNWLEHQKQWRMQYADTPVVGAEVQTGVGEAEEGNEEVLLCAPIPPRGYAVALEQTACTATVSPSCNARRPAVSDPEDTGVRPSKALRRLAPAPPNPRLQ